MVIHQHRLSSYIGYFATGNRHAREILSARLLTTNLSEQFLLLLTEETSVAREPWQWRRKWQHLQVNKRARINISRWRERDSSRIWKLVVVFLPCDIKENFHLEVVADLLSRGPLSAYANLFQSHAVSSRPPFFVLF